MERDQQNFENLRRLIALKRHEVPPPGYFDNFSREVMLRVKAGERGDSPGLVERLSWEATWFGRLWTALESRPAIAALCGVAFCGVLISGLVYSESKGDSAPIAVFMPPEMAAGMETATDKSALPPVSPVMTPVGATMAPSSTG